MTEANSSAKIFNKSRARLIDHNQSRDTFQHVTSGKQFPPSVVRSYSVTPSRSVKKPKIKDMKNCFSHSKSKNTQATEDEIDRAYFEPQSLGRYGKNMRSKNKLNGLSHHHQPHINQTAQPQKIQVKSTTNNSNMFAALNPSNGKVFVARSSGGFTMPVNYQLNQPIRSSALKRREPSANYCSSRKMNNVVYNRVILPHEGEHGLMI